MGERLGDLQPGDEFILPLPRRTTKGTFLRLAGSDAEVILEGPIGLEAYLSGDRLVLRTGRRSPHIEAVA